MALNYRIYSNGGSGGPVDYTSALATVSALTWTSGALTYPGDYTFAVRAFDTVTGYAESNADARARLVLDSSGANVTARPNAPANASAHATAGGGAHVAWTYNAAGQGGAPQGFRVWATAGVSVNYAASPSATVPYISGVVGTADLTGLSDGVSYSVGIRAYNAAGAETNTTAVTSVVGDASAPSDVESLAAVVSSQAG